MARTSDLAAISVILPVHNGETWLDRCMTSLLAHTILSTSAARLELSAFDDGSSATDPLS